MMSQWTICFRKSNKLLMQKNLFHQFAGKMWLALVSLPLVVEKGEGISLSLEIIDKASRIYFYFIFIFSHALPKTIKLFPFPVVEKFMSTNATECNADVNSCKLPQHIAKHTFRIIVVTSFWTCCNPEHHTLISQLKILTFSRCQSSHIDTHKQRNGTLNYSPWN